MPRKSGRFAPGESGNPKGRPRKDALDRDALERRLDGWLNQTTGMGVRGRDKAMDTEFCPEVVTWVNGQSIWKGDPIGARIVEVIPSEATRQGFELCIGDDDSPDRYTPPEPKAIAQTNTLPSKPPAGRVATKDVLEWARKHPSAFERRYRARGARPHRDAGDAKPLQEAVSKRLEDLKALAKIKECMCHERADGGAAMLIGANDYTTDLRQPLDLKRVRGVNFLTPLEAVEITPLYYYNDPFAPRFGEAAIYQLVPYTIGSPVAPDVSPRVTQIHESRLLIFPGVRVTRRSTQTAAAGWGDSVFTRVLRALRAFNTGHQNAETLLSDFAQAVYKIKGLAELITKNPNALTDSMMNVELGRSIARAVVIDAEEEFERKSTSLAGYADVLDRLAMWLAAVADMPLTLLMGQSPAGMNATGASDIRFFYDRAASVQHLRVAPPVMRLTEILLASMGEDPDKINHSIKFKPLWQPTEKEIAEAHFTQAQADAVYLDREVCSPEEIALSRFGGDQYSFETRIDFDARVAQEAVVAPTVNANPKPDPILQVGPTPEAAKQGDDTVKQPEVATGDE
jgi:phage-related protein (TIGR01555 family)